MVLDHLYDLPRPVLVTHGDVDGLCAVALPMRKLEMKKLDYDITISQPFSLSSDLVKFDPKSNFIIMDLAIERRVVDLLMPGTIVIDHHPSTLELKDVLERRGVLVKARLDKSASQLVFEELGGGKYNRYLSRLGAAGDWILNNPALGKQAGILASGMSLIPDDDWMRYYILGQMLNGVYVDSMSEAQRRSELAFQKLDSLRESGNYIRLFESDKFCVRFYEEGLGFASALANRLVKETKKTSFAVCHLNTDSDDLLITGRTLKKRGIDLRKIVSTFKKWGGYGGGHKKAASGVISKMYLLDFCKMLQKL